MKNLKYFFALCLLSSLFLTSCTKENPTNLLVDDSELMLDLYQSDAVLGTGEQKEENKFSYSVKYKDLPEDLQAKLSAKNELVLNEDLEISKETASRIWGDEIVGTPLENGFTIPKANREMVTKYMTPEGVDMTKEVEADPSIIADLREDLDIFAYHYEEITVTVIGSLIIITHYVERCIIIIF